MVITCDFPLDPCSSLCPLYLKFSVVIVEGNEYMYKVEWYFLCITFWIYLVYLFDMYSLVMEAQRTMKGKKVWRFVLSWMQLWRMSYLYSNTPTSNVWLRFWYQALFILNPRHLNKLWSMFACYDMIVIWLKLVLVTIINC